MAQTSDILGGLIGLLKGLAEGQAVKRLKPEIDAALRRMDDAERAGLLVHLKAAVAAIEVASTTGKEQNKKAAGALSKAFVSLLVEAVD